MTIKLNRDYIKESKAFKTTNKIVDYFRDLFRFKTRTNFKVIADNDFRDISNLNNIPIGAFSSHTKTNNLHRTPFVISNVDVLLNDLFETRLKTR